ncbi:hypothetical protein W97_03587 [Coniosporium apollinis CBS 100218]|uniref:FAD dependent oxidoreductase domain-containing protein n=1 Tax=Coniosporium apollinis (strain CBS 100218) TaxID=1168221 RepID=R7YRQ9_CONA1|nr:uncharacterized protein W97_03587 [Coniosporium apollinis CBS 100218]EON64356.1 hypothetical protein W97_03587 [Coniosporium apollinis CBS 100218]
MHNGAQSVWWSPYVRDFYFVRTCKAAPAFSQQSTRLASYTSISINVPRYLQYLLNRATSLGARIIRASLPTDASISGAVLAAETVVANETPNSVSILAFINATGIGALKLVPDGNVFPIRGQTVLVKGLAPQMRSFEDANPAPPARASISYIIPRPGTNTTILGGTKVAGDWRAESDEEITKDILKRCRGMAPELLNGDASRDEGFEVLAVNVGLRPGRKGGARVEIEEVETERGVRIVCHEYGHAGAGYQNSIGSAKKVIRLLEEYFDRRCAKAEDPKL